MWQDHWEYGAFTLLEIIIVVVVFGIGIVSTLVLLGNNVAMFQHTKTEQQASMLAHEGIQLFFHHRDNNLFQGYPRNYFDYEEGKEIFFGSGGADFFKIGYSGSQEGFILEQGKDIKIDDFTTNFDHYRLYLFSGDTMIWSEDKNAFSRYTHDETGIEDDRPIQYARYLVLTGVMEGNNLLPKDKILKLESHVLYKKGTDGWIKWWHTGEIVIETLIGNKGFSN